MDKRKLITSSERTVYTYNYLYSAAYRSLEQAEENEEGSFYNCMSSIILAAFCIEAYLNHIGSLLLPYWDEEVKKGLSINNKLKIICHHLNIAADYSRFPFQSFKHIVKYRNLLAHATSEKLTDKGKQIISKGEHIKGPETWWEKHTNVKTGKRWLSHIESIMITINKTAGQGDIPFGVLGIGSYGGTMIDLSPTPPGHHPQDRR